MSTVLAYGPTWLLLFLVLLIVVCVVLAWPRKNLPAPSYESVRLMVDGKELARAVHNTTHAMRAFNETWHGREYTPCKAALMDMGAMLDAI